MDHTLYANTKYSFERTERKTLVVNIPLTTATNIFDVSLPEYISVDAHSDIFLDSLTTFNCKTSNGDPDSMGFILSIDQFDIMSISNTSQIGRSIFIPNDQNVVGSGSPDPLLISKTHKGKKLNYICSINPTNINRISGKITNMASTPASIIGAGSAGQGRLVLEFVIITK
jgi:hypothetical protein